MIKYKIEFITDKVKRELAEAKLKDLVNTI